MNDANKMMTISELVKEGWNKELLYRICHMKNSPFFRTTAKKGKFYVFEDKLKEFCSTRRIGA